MSDAHAESLVAGELIRDVRRRSQLTQAELARRSGVPRSVLSAYERGHRQPAVAALARIAAAAGLELRLDSSGAREESLRAATILAQVLDLAELLPYRPRSQLAYPPLAQRAA